MRGVEQDRPERKQNTMFLSLKEAMSSQSPQAETLLVNYIHEFLYPQLAQSYQSRLRGEAVHSLEDVLQEVCIRIMIACRNGVRFNNSYELSSYCRQTIINFIHDIHRGKRLSSLEYAGVELFDALPAQLPEPDMQIVLSDGLRRILPHQADLLSYVGEGWSVPELQRKYSESTGVLKSRIHRARDALKKALR